jgi:hypothetical protein
MVDFAPVLCGSIGGGRGGAEESGQPRRALPPHEKGHQVTSIEVDQITPSLSGLRLGCVVRYGDEGPVRFCEAQIPWRVFTKDVRRELLSRFNAMVEQTISEEPLF